MLNIRTVILSVALVVILLLSVPLVTARTEVASDPASDASDPAGVFINQEQSANQNIAPIPSYRSPLDECYDVPLREANSCRNASRPPIPLYRSPLDECYDVPLREVASCRSVSQAPAPINRWHK